MRTVVAAVLALCLAVVVHGQGGIASAPAKFLVSSTQVVALRAGRLFDSRTGSMLSNPVYRYLVSMRCRQCRPSSSFFIRSLGLSGSR